MIFLGTWKDGSGVPFADNAHQLATTPAGGTAANTRYLRRPGPTRTTHLHTARALAHAWLHQLDEAARVLWDNCALAAWNRNNVQWHPDQLGFLAFNARNFEQMWMTGTYNAAPSAGVPGAAVANHAITQGIPAQQIFYDFDYNAAWAQQTQAQVHLYQVDPRNCANVPGPHNTRYLASESTWTPGGGHIAGWAPAAFPFTAWPPLRTLWRVANGSVFIDNVIITTT